MLPQYKAISTVMLASVSHASSFLRYLPAASSVGGMTLTNFVPQLHQGNAMTYSTATADKDAKSFEAGYVAPHPGLQKTHAVAQEWSMPNPVYPDEYLETVKPKHLNPSRIYQRIGMATVFLMRSAFDFATSYGPKMTEAQWLRRMIFLETVAGVPGMVGGMLRHLKSLRTMQLDQGWIHTLLEEAENERMHLLTFFELRKPGPLFRAMVILTQGIFFNLYFISYLLSPKTCHAFVGYLEEEAVKTYTHALKDIDDGKLWKDVAAPAISVAYWKLKPGASMRDVILAVRADEACHAHVNHTFSTLPATATNPFTDTNSQLP